MSSPDWLTRAAAAATLLLALAVGGCNVKPLYGTNPAGTPVTADLAAIDIVPVEGRVGQVIYNELNLMLNGGTGSVAPSYGMSLRVRSSGRSVAIRRIGGRPQSRNMNVSASFEVWPLGEETRRVIFSGAVSRTAAYDWVDQRFANDRAEMDAQDRAARAVAEEIRIRLATFFASGQRLPPQGGRIEDLPEGLEDAVGDLLYDPE